MYIRSNFLILAPSSALAWARSRSVCSLSSSAAFSSCSLLLSLSCSTTSRFSAATALMPRAFASMLSDSW